MAIITINKIRNGVIFTLARQFPDMDVYGEAIKENLEPPCLFVKLLSGEQKQKLGPRHIRYHTFDIHYFASTNRELHDMAEQLYDLLGLIKIGSSLYRGTSMNHEIIDGVLHFFVDYNFHVLKEVEPVSVMENLHFEGGLKGE